MEFANTTDMSLELIPADVDLSATGTIYITPEPLAAKLGDLARLKYRKGQWKGTLQMTGSAATVVVKLLAGGAELAERTIEADGSGDYHWAMPVNLYNVEGDEPIRAEVEVSVVDDGVTAKIANALSVEHPVMIFAGGGC